MASILLNTSLSGRTPCQRNVRILQVLGLVGTNGIGKSTALKILSGKLKPNLGKHEQLPDWETILAYFRGSELQNYFTRIVEENLKAVLKPQYVDHIPRAVRGPVEGVRSADDIVRLGMASPSPACASIPCETAISTRHCTPVGQSCGGNLTRACCTMRPNWSFASRQHRVMCQSAVTSASCGRLRCQQVLYRNADSVETR